MATCLGQESETGKGERTDALVHGEILFWFSWFLFCVLEGDGRRVRLFFSFHRGRRWVPGDLLNFFYFSFIK